MKKFPSVLIFCVFPFLLFAQISPIDIFQIDSNGENVINNLQYFESKSKEESIEKIAHFPSDSFEIVPEKHDFLIDSYSCWLKLELINSGDSSKKALLTFRQLHSMDLFLKNNGKWEKQNKFLQNVNHSFLGGEEKFIIFKLNPNEPKTVFFYKKQHGHIDFRGKIYQTDNPWEKNYEYLHQTFTKNIFRAGFLFIVAAFSLFTFLQYLQNKDNSYLLYSLYLLSIFLDFLWRSSLFFYTPFSAILASGWEIVYAPSHYLIIFFYMLFFRSFLNKNQPKEKSLHEWFTWSCYIVTFFLIVDLILVISGFVGLARLILDIGMIGMMICYSAFLWRIFQLPYGATRYLGWGTVALFIMAIADLLSKIEYVKQYSNFWNSYFDAIPLGILLEIIFFGLALGYRTKIMQQEKQQALKEKELEAAKAQLFTNITHEFGTPLTIIRGNASAILRNPKKELEQKIGHIHHSTDYLTSLVNDMLDLSKLESGQIALVKYKSDLVGYLNYLVESLRSYATEHKITLSFYAKKDRWEVDFSEKAMQQILTNLISNALKFTPIGGKVTVLLEGSDNQIIIRVSDTGKGIEKVNLNKVFDPFFQAEQTPENVVKGTGLGLAIVRQLVQLLQGKIEVESQLKKGTTFTVFLPATYQESALPKGENWNTIKPVFKSSNGTKTTPSLGILPKLLLVEDNLEVQNYLIEFLQNKYTILTANNGAEGLEIAKNEQPEIIISDEMMPIKSGFEMLKELKTISETRHIPVIMLTAKTARKYELEGLSLAADAYLTKPLDEQKLLLILQNSLNKKAQFLSEKQLLRWNGRIVIDPFMKALLTILEEKYNATNFETFQLKYELQKRGFGAARKVEKSIKQHFQTTPAKLIKRFRLAKAKQLLRTRLDLSIPQISDAVGLGSDQANFSRMYKEEFGITPANERN